MFIYMYNNLMLQLYLYRCLLTNMSAQKYKLLK